MQSEMFQQELLWGVAAWRLALAVFLVFIGFMVRKLIHALFKGALFRTTKKTENRWDDELVALMPAPLGAVVVVMLWQLAARMLQLPDEPVGVRLYLFQGLQVALIAAICWCGLRLVDVVSNALARLSKGTESRLDDQLIPLLRKTIKVAVVTVVAIMVIQNLGYSVTSLVASLGVGGLALALAAKDTIANVFGSLVVFTDRPFHVGDWVEVAGIEGTVEEVGFRTTQIRRFDKSGVTVPNSTFSSNPIVNHSRRSIRRIKMTLGLSYQTSAAQMRGFLEKVRELIRNHPDIDQGFNFVYLTEFGDSSLALQIYCFTKSTVWTDFLAAREDLMLSIIDLVEEHGLEIAFPTRTLYLREEVWEGEGSPENPGLAGFPGERPA